MKNKNDKKIKLYQNPVIKVGSPDTWQDYGVGDPYVMRYNGRYYLYCSTKDGEMGIKCHVSENLTDWSYAGLCTDEPLTKGAYAPEVVYHNGYFYMYTSPSGKGHYVLKSDSPTGPFRVISKNLGLSIDGSVFIDDDGKWYFYRAGYGGIYVYKMSAPNKINRFSRRFIRSDMHGWTEGPFVTKYNGLYYLSYTGNHVWSSGYRIGLAVSRKSTGKFKPVKGNPILLSTDKKTVMGVGHSCTVLSPDLDGHFIVYHSHSEVPKRSASIDRIIFNGENSTVLGPTVAPEESPRMPDLYSHFENALDTADWTLSNGETGQGGLTLYENGAVISRSDFLSDFSAEYNIKSVTDSVKIVFGYLDEKNHASIIYTPDFSEISVNYTVNGFVTENKIPFNMSFSDAMRKDALTVFYVRRRAESYVISVNNRELFRFSARLCGGKTGVLCKKGRTSVGFIGITSYAFQSSLSDVYKSAEYFIPAVFCVGSGKTDNLLRASENETYAYNVSVTESGAYSLTMDFTTSTGCMLSVYQNGKEFGELFLPSSDENKTRISEAGFTLVRGMGEILFVVKYGHADIYGFSFHKSEPIPESDRDIYEANGLIHKDGQWDIRNGCLFSEGPYGKYVIGSENYSSYSFEADVCVLSGRPNAGICVCVSNPSAAEKGSRCPRSGSNFLQGYYVSLSNRGIILGKHNYSFRVLKRVFLKVQKNKKYRLRIETNKDVLNVFVNDTHVITYHDTDSPYMHGAFGYKTNGCAARFDSPRLKKL